MSEQGTGTALSIFGNVEEVAKFVERAKYKHEITNPLDAIPTCIDGRDKQTSGYAAMSITARPGGSAGELMSVIALCNSLGIRETEAEYKKYMDIIGGPRNFCFHTDDTHPEPGTGCGHLNKALENSDAYGLDTQQMEFIFDKLPTIKEQGGEEEIRLGSHDEKGVLIVRSNLWSIHPFLDGEQAFIFNETFELARQELIARALYEEFSWKNPVLTEDDFIKGLNSIASKQLEETRTRIAKGKPLFLVGLPDNGMANIEAL